MELIDSSWLNVPLTYGLCNQTRQGIYVAKLGPMVLKDDGSIGEYNVLNENTWENERGALQLVATHGTSEVELFKKINDDILFGVNCVAGRYDNIVLLKNKQVKDFSKFYYCISTCLAYYERTLGRLVPMMIAAGVPKEKIKIIVAQSETERDDNYDGSNIYFSKFNAWEITTLIEAGRGRFDFDRIFMIHDTCDVGTGFYLKTQQIDANFEFMPIHLKGWNAMGMYDKTYLRRNVDIISRNYNNVSKRNGVCLETSGSTIQNAIIAGCYGSMSDKSRITHSADVYGTGDQRVREFFPNVDVAKYIKMRSFSYGADRRL